jgi:hypothetical protein
MVTKEALTLLNILIIYGLNHLIDTIVRRLTITLNMYPQAAIGAIGSRPDAEAAEEIIAVQLAAVGAIVLVPLKVQLTDIMQLMLIILLELTQVKHKMAMVPIGIIALVHLATISLRTTARGVTPKAQTSIDKIMGFALRHKLRIAVYIVRGITITVVLPEQLIPLILAHGDMYLWQHAHIEDPIKLARSPRVIRLSTANRSLLPATIVTATIIYETSITKLIHTARKQKSYYKSECDKERFNFGMGYKPARHTNYSNYLILKKSIYEVTALA